MKYRGLTISYSSAIARARRQTEQELIDKITVIESNLSESCTDEYNGYKSELK